MTFTNIHLVTKMLVIFLVSITGFFHWSKSIDKNNEITKSLLTDFEVVMKS